MTFIIIIIIIIIVFVRRGGGGGGNVYKASTDEKLLTIRLRQMRGSKFSRGIDSDRLLFNNNNYCSNGAKQG
jgi:preprotein translocase subunit SecG